MGSKSNGGAYVPGSNYNRTGAVDTGGTYVNATIVDTSTSGTVGASTVTAVETGSGGAHRTVLTLNALAMAVSDSNVGGGSLIYTFPVGNIAVLGATCSVAPTTTSVIASTLNSGVTLSVGVGSVATTTQGSGTLVTTQQDIITAFSATSSTTINVAAAAAAGKLSVTTVTRYDGLSTAQAVYLNCGVPTATDIDADATTTWTGTVTIVWTLNS